MCVFHLSFAAFGLYLGMKGANTTGGIKIANLTFFGADTTTELELPVAVNGVRLSFSGLYSDVVIDTIDLNKHLIKNPACTRFAYAEGSSMEDFRIFDGDLLVIDTSLPHESGAVVIVWVSEEQMWTAKKLLIKKTAAGQEYWLLPGNQELKPVFCSSPLDFIYGVLIHSITTHNKNVRTHRRK